ncbi:MAG: Methionyl-tRNA formyltransferase [Saezia sanguinis]
MGAGRLRIVYAGTPEFARVGLQAVVDAGYDVPLVLTQPDRPAGRGMKLQPSAVKQYAQAHQIDVLQPAGLKLDGRYAEQAQQTKAALQALQPDVMVVAAYGLILPQWVLELPKFGCLNIHASLLPRWRGAAPIHRAIEAGDAQTGVTIMQMDAGLDTGAMLVCGAVDIKSTDTTATLHDELAALGGQLVVQVLAQLQQGALQPQPQPEQGVCYAHKIDKAESRIDWKEPAAVIERRIRAFDPFPGAAAQCGEHLIKLWQAQALSANEADKAGQPGQVLKIDEKGIHILTGDGILAVSMLQRPGGKRQPAHAFLQSVPMVAGDLLL